MRHTLHLLRTEALLANAWARGVTLLAVLAALGFGLLLGRMGVGGALVALPDATADRVTHGRPGAWGEIEYVPISVQCPDELLPTQAFEAKVTHWLLKDYTVEKFFALLEELGITGDLRDEFRSPQVLHPIENGFDLTPTQSIILKLPPKARTALYTLLARTPENASSLVFVLEKTLGERFAGVSPTTVDWFRRLSCEYGRYLVFSDVPTMFSLIPTYEERVQFLKGLTWQRALMVKLRVTPESNLPDLTAYWGKASRAKDVRSLFESLARIPGGVRLDISQLLPPSPTSLLNTFPLPANPLNGPAVRQDCHWTAFNFFRDPPDARCADNTFIMRTLKDDYVPVLSDPRYGDLVLFLTPEGTLIHSAVFLADQIVYTKNGDTSLHPWMLSTVQDLVDQYSFQVPPDKALEVKFFRGKYF